MASAASSLTSGPSIPPVANAVPAYAVAHHLAFRQVVIEQPVVPASASATPTTSGAGVKPSPIANGRDLSNALRAAAAASTAPPAPCSSVVTTATSACLTPDVQKQVQLLGNCSQLNAGKAEAAGYDDPAKPIAACDRTGAFIYVLAPQYMSGTEVKKAQALYDSAQGYLVQLNFSGTGTRDFGKMTAAVTSLQQPLNQVAIVLDGVVKSAPTIQTAIYGGTAQITGGTGSAFTQADTDSLAKDVNAAALPYSGVKFTFLDAAGWNYSGFVRMSAGKLQVSKNIASSPPGTAKVSYDYYGPAATGNGVYHTTNDGRPDGPALTATLTSYIYPTLTFSSTAAPPAGIGECVWASGSAEASGGEFPAELDCRAVGDHVTGRTTVDGAEKTVDTLVTNLRGEAPAALLEFRGGQDDCRVLVRADGTTRPLPTSPAGNCAQMKVLVP